MFFDWCENINTPILTAENARINVAIADAAYRSLESGIPEAIS